MKVLLIPLALLLVGCGSPSKLQKAQQQVVCADHGGVYKYASSNFEYSRCNDGTSVPPGDWSYTKGPSVLKEMENATNR